MFNEKAGRELNYNRNYAGCQFKILFTHYVLKFIRIKEKLFFTSHNFKKYVE